jgi:hypothetical protein
MSEMARQVYEDILGRGFISPETAVKESELVGSLLLTNINNYKYFLELKELELFILIPATSVYNSDRYYAVPPTGWLANQAADQASLVWTKWGTIAGVVAIPLSLALWFFT